MRISTSRDDFNSIICSIECQPNCSVRLLVPLNVIHIYHFLLTCTYTYTYTFSIITTNIGGLGWVETSRGFMDRLSFSKKLLLLLLQYCHFSYFLRLFVVSCFVFGTVNSVRFYDTGASVVEGKLNIHLVPHSHDDVGWLKTIDQYYVGSNYSIQNACVENVLDSVVQSLRRDANRKFVFAEQAFFQRWWTTQSDETKEEVKKLVHSGQLEFVNGGWCMHDEATTHYIDMIDQTTLGHLMIKKQFNKVPRAGWQIDTFGHSSVQGYLLGAELGLESLHFARIDYQDRANRAAKKSLEVIWRGSKTFGSSSQIFANAFPVHYGPPPGFRFEVSDDSLLIQDNPLLFDRNVEQRVNDFIDAAMIQANVTRTNHIMWTMGGDFEYQYAETWFKQMDKLIHYVNKDGRVNALYSTPSIYTDEKNALNVSWPLKTDDYFPYADRAYAYWTGYFTSRAGLKGYIRTLSGYYLAARQLEVLAGRRSNGPNTYSLGDALGISQHHDAITGTAKQHTTNDYAKRLAIGATEAEAVVAKGISCLTNRTSHGCVSPNIEFSQCQLINISYCPSTEEDVPEGKSLVVVAYNPLGWHRTDLIRIPVNHENLIVQDSTGNTIDTQYIMVDNVTGNLRTVYTAAYLGIPAEVVPKYWLLFPASVPPLGWNTYFISKTSKEGKEHRKKYAGMNDWQIDTIRVGPGNLKMDFSSTSGQLKRIFNTKTGVDMSIQQNYLWYNSSGGDLSDPQSSGAYIFRPNGAPATVIPRAQIPLKVVRGSVVDEVHQQFSPWIYQVTRLYKDKDHAEVEFTIGPIPSEDGVGKEVITRLTTNMATNKVFFTDSNGRDFLKRVRDYREDWSLEVNQPVAGNYYPLALGIFIKDRSSEFSVLVDRAVGGGSINDGEVEIMLHRRILYDDSRGVDEALDEILCSRASRRCEGLTVRGKYYMRIDKLGGGGARWRRTTGQEVYSPLVLAFTHESKREWMGCHRTKGTAMDPNYRLPQNVALITLQELEDDGRVLLRLAHLYEAGEDAEYSKLARVELKKMFAGRTIRELTETSLSGNQEKSRMKKSSNAYTWRVEDKDEPAAAAAAGERGGPVDPGNLVVVLGPMEIRTFLFKF